MTVILASKSLYKQKQLRTLGISFQSCAPDIEENHSMTSDSESLALTLAEHKAKAIHLRYPKAIIIGSDQTAKLSDGQLLTKPVTIEKAIQQLINSSSKSACFHSAVSLINGNHLATWSIKTVVKFRSLTLEEITRYVDADQPLDCAGSFKVESLGITLFESIQSDDPTALVGLPLISLSARLREFGIQAP